MELEVSSQEPDPIHWLVVRGILVVTIGPVLLPVGGPADLEVRGFPDLFRPLEPIIYRRDLGQVGILGTQRRLIPE